MNTTPEESLFMLRTAWQQLRAQYLKLVEMQKAGHPADLTLLAQAFIDMNSALEATMGRAHPRTSFHFRAAFS